jgi:hypothetical protein
MIRLTSAGREHTPEVPYHFAAWGAIKELLRVKDDAATREEILGVLEYCWHRHEKYQPNTAYLGYALKNGWLAED